MKYVYKYILVYFLFLSLLQNNTISGVEPGSFRDQSQLLELALNGNRIHLLTPNMLQGLEQLRILYLSGNDITRLLDYTFQGLQVKHIRTHWSFHEATIQWINLHILYFSDGEQRYETEEIRSEKLYICTLLRQSVRNWQFYLNCVHEESLQAVFNRYVLIACQQEQFSYKSDRWCSPQIFTSF